MQIFVYFGNFSLRMGSFVYISTSGLKSDSIFEFSAPVFSIKTWPFLTRDAFSVNFVAIISAHAHYVH